ncbi:SDR family oxidoreductase [Paenibacillus assamensis]|uniref:SDR family oxidoreductase n=1 Tax=Paenibacillus assamensis TaxID=311244 RepID=UPI000412FA71|nr:SDR family oxidoreductase [Paenibacillus assamensis]
MDLHVKGKVAIVLASSKGLGYAAAEALAAEGAQVTLVGRSADSLAVAASRLQEKTGAEALTVEADITSAESIKRIVQLTVERFGTVDILVNNCGGPKPGKFDQLSDEMWQEGFELTLLSYVRAIREVLPYMRKSGSGRIVNITSSSIKQPIETLMLSSTFRVGVVGLAKTLAPQLAQEGILINTVGPGRFATDRVEQLDELVAQQKQVSIEEIQAAEAARIPIGRYGSPEEMGRLIAFLASPANSYMTGQSLLADGGTVNSI